MRYVNNIIVTLTRMIMACLIFTAPANASGFIFHWEPFVMDSKLTVSGETEENTLISNPFILDSKIPIADDDADIFLLSTPPERASIRKSERKSITDNIKFNFLLSRHMMNDTDQALLDNDDDKLSNLIHAITDLIYEDSKIDSLETISKIIEPQINFHFEF